MKIAIKFKDNDFYNCFTGVLNTLLNGYKHCDGLPNDKEKLCKIINEISYGCYLIFQNQFEYHYELSGELCQKTKQYLHIESNQILINDEVDVYFNSLKYPDENTFVLDTDLDYPNNSSIFSL